MPEDLYQPVVINPDDGPALDIEAAKVLAAVNSRRPASKQWTELKLYKTRGGEYVCVQIGHTLVDRQRIKTTATRATTEAQIIEFFGQRWLAKLLYSKAGINATVKVA